MFRPADEIRQIEVSIKVGTDNKRRKNEIPDWFYQRRPNYFGKLHECGQFHGGWTTAIAIIALITTISSLGHIEFRYLWCVFVEISMVFWLRCWG